MRPDVVVDVGNSLIKWGRCAAGTVAQRVVLPHDDYGAWERQLAAWDLDGPLRWVVAAVHPPARDTFLAWLRRRGETAQLIDKARQLPLAVRLENPDAVGIDRLLNAVAANTRRPPGSPAVLVGAGTAVTVDWLNAAGAFCGGAILPGFRLAARALYEHTELLPLIAIERAGPPLPGTSTAAALQAGVYWAAAGGTRAVIHELLSAAPPGPVTVFLTGGDARLLEPALEPWLQTQAPTAELISWPRMTLEGIRLAAEAMP